MADTKIVIAAVDQASEVFGRVQSAAERLQGSYARLAGFLTAGIGVGAFTALMKSTIDAADELNKLSQKTGIAVDELSKLKYVAELSGVNTQALGKGIKALSAQMVEAGDSTSKASKLFRAMGVDISGGPMPTLEKLADVFAGLEDGEIKTTLATQLFGKAGMDLIPMLNQGKAGMEKLKEEAIRLGLVLSDETAKAAEQFNDNMRAIKASGEGLGISLLNELAPSLVRVSEAMKEAAVEGGILQAIWIGMGGALSELLGINASGAARIRQINEELARLNAEIQSGANAGLIVQQALIDQRRPRIKQLEDELRLLKEQGAAEDVRRAFRGASATGSTVSGQAIRDALSGKEAAAGMSAFRKELEALMATIQGKALGLTADYAKQMGMLNNAYVLGLISLDQYADAMVKLTAQQPVFTKAAEDQRKAMEALAKADEQVRLEIEALMRVGEGRLQGLQDEVNFGRIELELLGRSNVERAVALLDYQKELALRGVLNDATRQGIELKFEELKQLALTREAREQELSLWNQLGDVMGDFFSNLVMKGKSAFDSLKQWLKEMLAQMIKIFATRWVLQLAAGAAGASGNSALANSLGSSAMNYGSSTLVGAGAAYLFGTAGATAVGAGATGAFAGSVATGAVGSAGVIGSGGAMASVYSALSAIPVWGWIAMAVIAAVAFFSGRGGGPKVEGSSVGSFDFSGADRGAYRVSDEYGNRFLAGTQMDSALDPLRIATGGSYRNLVSRLGGTFGTAGFGFGASNDPAGDARSRVFGSAMVNGRNVFDGIMDVDDKEVDAALMLTSKRAILAALQATDFADEIDAIFAGAGDVARLTGEQIDAIIASAREMYSVIDGLGQLGNGRFGLTMTLESLRLFAAEGETIGQTFQRVGGAWLQLVDAFSSDATKLETARFDLAALYDDLRAFGAEVPTTREGWLDVARSLNDGSAAGAELFSRMIALGSAFDAVSNAAEAMKAELQGLAQLRFLRSGGTEQGFNIQTLRRNNPLLAAGTAGMSEEAFIRNLWTISDTDYARYSATDRQIINSILRADLNNTTAIRDLGVALGGGGSGRSQQEIDFESYYRTQGARRGLRTWADNTMMGDLSPLPPDQQMQLAYERFQRTLGLAQGGDVDAIGRLSGDSETYLRLARQMFGSSSTYVDSFNAIMRGVDSVASPAASTAKFQTDSIGYQASMATDLTSVRRLLERIADREDGTLTEPSADKARR